MYFGFIGLVGVKFRVSIGGRVRFWLGPGTQLDPIFHHGVLHFS